jgi:hypothetical protein
MSLRPNQSGAASIELTGSEITSLLSDRILISAKPGDNSEQLFQKAGATFFTQGQNQQQGQWKVVDNKYCSVWPPSENWVCYVLFRDGENLRFVSPSGNTSDWKLQN